MYNRSLVRISVLIVSLFVLSGCAKTKALVTLKRISNEQKTINKDVEIKDAMFDSLLNIVRSDLLKDYSDEKSVVDNFGEPIFKKDVEYKGSDLKQWLYRYQARYFDSDKVYLYFDDNGTLVDYMYVPYKEN